MAYDVVELLTELFRLSAAPSMEADISNVAPPSTWAQQAAALIAGIENDTLRVALRDGFEERAAIAEYDGGLTRDEAERVAFEEVRDIRRGGGSN